MRVPTAPDRYDRTNEAELRAIIEQAVNALELRGSIHTMSSDRGDANVTLVAGTDLNVQRFATALGANRTVTLGFGANGSWFRIVRTGLGAFTLDVGGLKTIPSATAAVVEVTHDGGAWRLTDYSPL